MPGSTAPPASDGRLVGMADPLATNRGTPLSLNLLPGASAGGEVVPLQLPEQAKRIIEDCHVTV